MHYPSVAVALVLFWLLLSGHYTALLLTLGATAVALVIWFLRRMDRRDGLTIDLRPGFGLFRYAAWLSWTVIKSNIDVARRIWSPDLPIRPTWGWLEVRAHTPLQKTLYANSITLTPGTLTAQVDEQRFLIHALTAENLAELREGEMERRLLRSGV